MVVQYFVVNTSTVNMNGHGSGKMPITAQMQKAVFSEITFFSGAGTTK